MDPIRITGWWLPRIGFGLGAAIFGLYLGLWVGLISGGGSDQADFTAFYTGWTIVLRGDGAALYDPVIQAAVQHEVLGGRGFEAGINPFNNPPHLVLPFVLLAALPLRTAYLVWAVLQLVLLGWLMLRLWRVAAADWRPSERLLLLGAALSATPLLITLLQGSFSLLLAVAVVETWIALRRGREAAAGRWLLLASVKPQAVVTPLVAMAAAMRWRMLAWFVGGGLLLAAITSVALGPRIWSDYLSFLGGYVSSFDVMSVRPSVMWNLRGTLTLIIGPDVTAAEASLINQLALVAQVVGFLVVAALWFRRWDPGTASFDLRFALTLVIGLVLSPHLNPHDALLLVPAAAIAYGAIRDRPWGRWAGAAMFLAPFLVLLTNPIDANDPGSGPIRMPVLLMAVACIAGVLALRAIERPALPTVT